MSDTQSVYHVVMKAVSDGDFTDTVPAKVFATRKNARQYAEVMNREYETYYYWVYEKGVKLG